MLAGFCAAAILLFAFLGIAGAISKGGAHAIDKAILLALRAPGGAAAPIGPHWLQTTMLELTCFGDNAVLTAVVASAALYLIPAGRRALAVLAVGAAGSGAILSTLLKAAFNRPRPDFVAHLAETASASFPSGHAMMSAITYLTLGGILAAAQTRKRLKTFAIGLAIALTSIMGFTRLYLGVHYPSDVLAGWALGAAWALMWLMIVYRFRAHRAATDAPKEDER